MTDLLFGTHFHIYEGLLCAEACLVKQIGSGSTKILSPLRDFTLFRQKAPINDLFKCSNLAQNSVLWMSRCVQNLVRRNRKLRELLADSVDL